MTFPKDLVGTVQLISCLVLLVVGNPWHWTGDVFSASAGAPSIVDRRGAPPRSISRSCMADGDITGTPEGSVAGSLLSELANNGHPSAELPSQRTSRSTLPLLVILLPTCNLRSPPPSTS